MTTADTDAIVNELREIRGALHEMRISMAVPDIVVAELREIYGLLEYLIREIKDLGSELVSEIQRKLSMTLRHQG